MIDIPFSNGKTYQLKNSWEELTADEFRKELSYIAQFMAGDISLGKLRMMTFLLLSGEKIRLHPNREIADRQAENIVRIAHQMTFMLRIEYENAKSFSKLKKDIREKLERYLPEELEETPEIRWAAKSAKSIAPDIVFAKNLIPVIGRRRHTLKGYTFDVTDNILNTSLTTSQFIDAQTVALEIQESGKDSLLNLLVAILYVPYRQNLSWPYKYDSQQATQLSKTLGWLDKETKNAIFINFNAIQTFLTTHTKYSILFNSPAAEPVEAKPKHTLGLGTVAHSLIKSGYADIDNSNLVKFFEIMYSDLVNNVVSLHKQGNGIDKISELTGLSISKINQII